MLGSGPTTREALFAGLALGAFTTAVDALMVALSPDVDAAQLCFNLVLSGVLYALAGYLGGAFTGKRRQGAVAGGVAALVAGIGGVIAEPVLTGVPHSLPWYLGMGLFGIALNLPLGLAFGYLGGSLEAKED